MKEAEPPEIFDVVELPEEEKGGKCTLWGDDTEEYIPCGNEVEYVFVHAATNRDHDGNDERRNCLACERCVNIVAPEPKLVADGGTERFECPSCGDKTTFSDEKRLGLLTCDSCGYTPRRSVRQGMRGQ